MSKLARVFFLMLFPFPVFGQEAQKPSGEVAKLIESAEAHQQRQEFREALQDIERAIELAPGSADLYIRRAKVRFQTGNVQGARADFDKAVELEPKSGEVRYERGQFLSNNKQWKESMADLEEALRLEYRTGEVFAARAYIHKMTGNQAAALENYNLAVSMEPKNDRHLISRGFQFFEMKNYDAALNDFSAALQIDPKNALAYLGKSQIYRKLHRSDDMLQALDQVIANDSSNNTVLQETASSEPGRPRHSGTNGPTQVLTGSLSWMAHIQKGNEYYRVKKHAEAVKEFDVVLATSPNDVSGRLFRALSLTALGKYDAALKDYDEAIRFSNDQQMNFFLHLERGFVLTYLNRDDEAGQAFETAFKMVPNAREGFSERIEKARKTRRPGDNESFLTID
jgi:tetratricopeptide (TPR) repeat protein